MFPKYNLQFSISRSPMYAQAKMLNWNPNDAIKELENYMCKDVAKICVGYAKGALYADFYDFADQDLKRRKMVVGMKRQLTLLRQITILNPRRTLHFWEDPVDQKRTKCGGMIVVPRIVVTRHYSPIPWFGYPELVLSD